MRPSYSCGVQKTSTFIDLFFTRTGIFGHFLVYCPSFCNVVILQTATKKGILHAATLALYNELSVWFCIFSISPIWGLNPDLQSEVLGVNHSATTPSKWAVDILQNEERGLRGAYTPQNPPPQISLHLPGLIKSIKKNFINVSK